MFRKKILPLIQDLFATASCRFLAWLILLSSATSDDFQRITWNYIPEYRTIPKDCREKLAILFGSLARRAYGGHVCLSACFDAGTAGRICMKFA
jgi:hypothetical protein